MADETVTETQGDGAEPSVRVRRRRSHTGSKRHTKIVQTRVPLTDLRLAWRGPPSAARLTVALISLTAIGLGAASLLVTGHTDAILDQARAQLEADTRGAARGQAAAEQLAAEAQAAVGSKPAFATPAPAQTDDVTPGAYSPFTARRTSVDQHPDPDDAMQTPQLSLLPSSQTQPTPQTSRSDNVMGYTLPSSTQSGQTTSQPGPP